MLGSSGFLLSLRHRRLDEEILGQSAFTCCLARAVVHDHRDGRNGSPRMYGYLRSESQRTAVGGIAWGAPASPPSSLDTRSLPLRTSTALSDAGWPASTRKLAVIRKHRASSSHSVGGPRTLDTRGGKRRSYCNRCAAVPSDTNRR